MQILERQYPTKPAEPGKPERREQESIRHGTRVWTASLVVPAGEVVWEVGQTRTSEDFAVRRARVAERFVDRKAFEEFEDLLRRFLDNYNARHAHPFRWPNTGQPLVCGTPFRRTRRQQKHGRAWFSPRPQLFERLVYPPQPYHHIAV